MKFFNTAGPCLPDWHYLVPPQPRLPELRELVARRQYFVLHAPRQSGKTTTLLSYAKTLTDEGEYLAVYLSCETAEAAQDNYLAAHDRGRDLRRRRGLPA